jgi:hypothetical protein
MGNINVGHLYKKRTVRRLSGEIIDLVDEANGGYIIRGGRVVNQELFDEMARKEEDRKIAAQAILNPVAAPAQVEESRTVSPSKLSELEKRIDSQDAKLDAILAALKK